MPLSISVFKAPAVFGLPVNAYAARPNGKLFARSITSSRLAKVAVGAIGPNGSSVIICAESGTFASKVG